MRIGSGMLVLTSKLGDYDRIVKLAKRAGREKDVLRFAPDASPKLCTDVLAWELQNRTGATVENAAKLIDMLSELGQRQHGDSEGKYWVAMSGRVIRLALMAIRMAYGGATLTGLYRFITVPPMQAAVLAKAKEQVGEEHPDYQLVASFFGVEFKELASKTKGIVLSVVNSTLAPFQPSEIQTLVSNREGGQRLPARRGRGAENSRDRHAHLDLGANRNVRTVFMEGAGSARNAPAVRGR